MPPDYGQEATQMFSQRNNPYCDLLSNYAPNINKKLHTTIIYLKIIFNFKAIIFKL